MGIGPPRPFAKGERMEVRGFAILHCSQLTGTLTLPSPLFKGEAERSRLLRIAKVTDPWVMTSPQPFRQTLTPFVIRPLVCRTRRSRDAAQRSGLCGSTFAAFTDTHLLPCLCSITPPSPIRNTLLFRKSPTVRTLPLHGSRSTS
jgi:hypothetical protein